MRERADAERVDQTLNVVSSEGVYAQEPDDGQRS
jgi:hypothetical protein